MIGKIGVCRAEHLFLGVRLSFSFLLFLPFVFLLFYPFSRFILESKL